MGNYIYFKYGSYGFILLAALISLLSQLYVHSNYKKYSQIGTVTSKSGAQVAREILNQNNLYDVEVVQSKQGVLSDHYDPNKKVVALSPKVYNESSIASLSIAAHEVGHAIQDAESYHFLKLRNKILPVALISGQFSYLPIMLGFLAGNNQLINIGLFMLILVAIFQFVTLPLEFDASKRGYQHLKNNHYLINNEVNGSRKMLTSAALTYVAALFGTLLTILRYLVMSQRYNDNQKR